MDFLEKLLAWFSKFYLRVQSEICGSNNLFICSFQNFFKFSAKYFQTFGQKTSRSCQNYLPRVQMNKFWLEKFFKNFEPFWIFWRTWAWFSNFIFVSRVKNPEESFFILLFRIFSDFERKSFQTFGQKTSRNCKNLPSACSDEQFLAWNFFQKFWAVLDFLRKTWHGAQTSIFVSTVKIPEEMIFLIFFYNFFRILSGYFSDFRPKNFKFSNLPSTCPVEHVVAWIFFKKIESFWIFCRNLWHGSQNSIHVSRVKIAKETFVLFDFSLPFRNLSEMFSDFWPKNFKKLSKLPSTCVEEQFVAWNFFSKVLSRFGFSSENLAWFSNFYLRVQSKNSGRNDFLIFFL